MKILISGAAGHLGAALVGRLSARHTVMAATRRELDVCDGAAVAAAVRAVRPDAIINCAAYTNVDRAEEEPVAALAVNAIAVRTLAAAACRTGSALVHYSTDFVFDGRADRPYTEADAANPRSTYASSKLLGEWFAADVPRHYVLRVESLFGAQSVVAGQARTSVDRIVDAIMAGEEVRVFTDRTVSPSYIADICDATAALLERGLPAGLYHCVNSGHCSFAELAREAGRQLGRECRLVPVAMRDLALRAERPLYCALSNRRLAGVGVVMPSWQDALKRALRARGALTATS